MTQDELRAAFEEVAFARYFQSTIKRNPNPPQPKISGALDFVPVDCKEKAVFLRRDPDGNYDDFSVDAAWWGWQLGYEFLQQGLLTGKITIT